MKKSASQSKFSKLIAAAALSAVCCAANAQSVDDTRNAAIADGVTTALGIAVGAVEANPLGPILAIGMKSVVFQYAETLPDTERPRVYAAATSMWQGAAANNLCVTAAILTGGSFAPVCLVVGVAWGLKTWQDSEHERLFWEGCAMLRQYANEPDLQCVYRAPETEIVMEATASEIVVHEVQVP
jgi:hypothetical protein